MRNLIIQRKRTVVGCSAKLQVYITDPQSNDLVIHGTPCRFLGILRNAETLTISIADTSARVYILPDSLSKDLPCEYCDLLPGTKDVFLSGKCRFDPLRGNPFHFDGNTAAPGTKNSRLFIIALLCVVGITAGLILGKLIPQWILAQQQQQPQIFSAEGMQITLTSAFRQVDGSRQGFILCYTSPDTNVYIIKEDFAQYPDLQNLSVEQYAQLVLSNNPALSGGRPAQEDDLTIFEYTQSGNRFMMVFLKGPDGFWIFEFAATAEKADSLRQAHLNYAKSICFPSAAI